MSSNPLGIIQQFLHPPVNLTSLEALPGNPYTAGIHGLQRIRGPVNVDAFGLHWLVTLAPAGYGLNVGAAVNYYDRTILQIGVQHADITGTVGVTQQLDTRLVTGYIMFDEALPFVVDVLIAPGVEINFDWVLLL